MESKKLSIKTADAGYFIQGIGYHFIIAILLTIIASILNGFIGLISFYLGNIEERNAGINILYIFLSVLFLVTCFFSAIAIIKITTSIYQRKNRLNDSEELGKYMLFNVLSICGLPISLFVHIPAGVILYFVTYIPSLQNDKGVLVIIAFIYAYFVAHFLISMVINGYVTQKQKKENKTDIIIPLNSYSNSDTPHDIRW